MKSVLSKSGLFRYELISALLQREIASRYKGTYLGLAWSFINPLFMLAIYTFVFGTVFKARWSGDEASNADFALALFAGLIIYSVFAECVNRAPTLMHGNTNYVKKVVFPLEILPVVVLGGALFQAFVSILMWLVAAFFIVGSISWTVIFVPMIFMPLILFVLGMSWLFSSLGVYLRDLSQFTTIFTTVLLFMSPVFYSASMLPEEYQFLFLLNPLTPIVEQFRAVLFFGEVPDWYQFAISCGLGMVFALFGYWWFQKTRKGFADVL